MNPVSNVLLDSSVLIALTITDHEHHPAAATWLGSGSFAMCPITEGALIRTVARSESGSVTGAIELLAQMASSKRADFWPDDISYRDVLTAGVVGHKQVTDAYLAQLARSRNARLATFDRALAALHADVTELVPTT